MHIRSEYTQNKIQEFFGLSAYYMVDIAEKIVTDTKGLDDFHPDKTIEETKSLLRFLAALDSSLSPWTDKEVNLYIEHTISKYGMKNYPIVPMTNWGARNVRITLPSFGSTGNVGTGTRLQDQAYELRFFNGRWVMSLPNQPSFLTLAAKEEVVTKEVYNNEKSTFATRDETSAINESITTQNSKIEGIEVFNGRFNGSPEKVVYTDNFNKPEGPLQLDANGKVPNDVLPNSGAAEVFKGFWNAQTNTPQIPPASEANKGWYYRVSTAGGTVIDGFGNWVVDAKILSDGARWANFPPPNIGGASDSELARGDLDLDNVNVLPRGELDI